MNMQRGLPLPSLPFFCVTLGSSPRKNTLRFKSTYIFIFMFASQCAMHIFAKYEILPIFLSAFTFSSTIALFFKIKFRYSEKATKFGLSYNLMQLKGGRSANFSWPSQNIWTLKHFEHNLHLSLSSAVGKKHQELLKSHFEADLLTLKLSK